MTFTTIFFCERWRFLIKWYNVSHRINLPTRSLGIWNTHYIRGQSAVKLLLASPTDNRQADLKALINVNEADPPQWFITHADISKCIRHSLEIHCMPQSLWTHKQLKATKFCLNEFEWCFYVLFLLRVKWRLNCGSVSIKMSQDPQCAFFF